jgi:hypothetical protein
MPPRIPIELVEAKINSSAMWKRYDDLIENGATLDEKQAALKAMLDAEKTVGDWYKRWQALGGTSNIGSIVEAELATQQHGDDDLGTRVIVSGGEALEIDAPQRGGDPTVDNDIDDIPF